MIISTLTLEDFLRSDGRIYDDPAMVTPPGIVSQNLTAHSPLLLSRHGYTIYDLGAGDVVAVTSSGDEAGFYSGDTITVHPGHGGGGLGTALVLWAYEAGRTLPDVRYLTKGGEETLKKAWNVAHRNAQSRFWP